ncbi:hypothetical protein Ahy_B10g104137 [Arachis hypogaea]|uniref:Aminotransferase-like plant mobile domain-containing protein n=1 Tax=Arachis hypogaea TaxID=3818 RepID=A0A444X4U1_ARAHY|nr:hypothetical protein Ahy_B10g104137 [Arachis hypogaea]
MAEENHLYRLNDIAHVVGSIIEELNRCIYNVRRQQNMPLHDRIIPYLKISLYHLSRLNTHWFWVDEHMVSIFIERWCPEMHTFHMPFGECTITLQDVSYQLGLFVDREVANGCLTDFEQFMEDGKPAWEWFQELFSEMPPPNKVKHMTFPTLRPHGFETFAFSLASRWVTYLPTLDAKEQRLIQIRLALDRLCDRDFVWEFYFAAEVVVVVHP